MNPERISTDKIVNGYSEIRRQMNRCIDDMALAAKCGDDEQFERVLARFSKLRDLRTHFQQKIDMLSELLMEVEEIADQVNKI